MNFEKPHRREPTEPQLATMIDVFSILIIFLIAGTAMDSSILNIPNDIILPKTISKSSTLNAPQITIEKNIIMVNFINEKINYSEIVTVEESSKLKNVRLKVEEYLKNVEAGKKSKKSLSESQLLQSLNLVAGDKTSYEIIFNTIKWFKDRGFQNTILVATEGRE
jgi:biopolymer transport protein ExbD